MVQQLDVNRHKIHPYIQQPTHAHTHDYPEWDSNIQHSELGNAETVALTVQCTGIFRKKYFFLNIKITCLRFVE